METIDNLIADEGGLKKEPYFCTSGKLAWLIGRNIEDRPLTEEEIKLLRIHGIQEGGELIFYRDFENHYKPAAEKYIPENTPGEIKAVIFNMMYNMGEARFNPGKWPNFFKAVGNKDWKEVAIQMKYTSSSISTLSKWYVQVGKRAERLVNVVLYF